MKHNKHSPAPTQNPANIPQPAAVRPVTSAESNFTPTPDEVARRAYFTYVNEGSRDGHEVQHWLQAEAELIAERKLTRTHGFHNQT
jgi:hypothetical protein